MGTPAAPPPPGSIPPPMDATTLPPGHVANPAYRHLFQAYSAAYGGIADMREAMDPSVRTFHSTDAWLGPEARAWGGGMEDRRKDLRKAADTILWDIYTKLTATQRSLPIS